MLGPRFRWMGPHVVFIVLPPDQPGIFSRHGSQLLHLTKIHTESNNVTCAAQPLQCTSFCFLQSNIGCFAQVHQQLCTAGRPTQLTIQVHRHIAQSTRSHLRANNDCTVLVGSSKLAFRMIHHAFYVIMSVFVCACVHVRIDHQCSLQVIHCCAAF